VPVPVEHRRLVRRPEQGEHGDGDQDLGVGHGHAGRIFTSAERFFIVPERVLAAGSVAQEGGGEDVGAELGKGAGLLRAL
jgi:hypothetical protein